MTFEQWNSALLERFFHPGNAGRRVHFSVSEDGIREFDGETIESFTDAVKQGPNQHLKYARSLFSSAKALKDSWHHEGCQSAPTFLPYLGLFVLASNYDNTDGSEGY